MKSKYILAISTLLLIAFSFTSCKKYEDGPKVISLRTVKSRLTNGEWKLKEFIADGVDSTDYYNEIDFSYNFEKDGSSSSQSLYDYTQTFTYLGQLNEVEGKVYFEDNGDYMLMKIDEYGYYDPNNYWDFYLYDYPSIFGAYYLENAPRWKIEKLTNSELWMTCKYNKDKNKNKSYIYSMKLVKE